MNAAPAFDARWFLTELWGGKPDDLYLLIWKLAGRRSFWFRSIDDAAGALTALTGHDVYIGAGLSSTDHGPTRRGTASEVAGIAGVWVDIDIASAAHNGKPLPSTLEEARSILPPEAPPTVLISTGNGLHAWWLFKEPWIFDDGGERDEAARLVLRWNQLLASNAAAHGWSLDRLADLSRVMRIPGTTNFKDPVNPKSIEVAHYSGQRYEPSYLDELLDSLGVQAPKAPKPLPTLHGGIAVRLDATIEQSRIDGWADLEPRFLATWQRRRRDLADQSQSGYDLALADFGVDAGLSDQEIADLICYHRRLHGQKPRKVADYYERTIAKARGERIAGAGNPVPPVAASATHGAPVRPESGSLPANPSQSHDHRAKAFEQLSNYAGVGVLRLVKLTGEEPSYRLHLEGGLTLHFADVGKLINQTTVRNALVGATNRLVSKLRTKQWELVVAAMLSVLEEEDGGPECDRGGMIRLYLDSYLRDVQFIPAIEGQPSHVARRPLVLRDTVERKGAICAVEVIAVSAVDLQQHVSRTFGAPYSVKALASMLAAIGAKSRPVLHHGSRIQGRWLLPPEEFNPEDYAARAEAEEGVQE